MSAQMRKDPYQGKCCRDSMMAQENIILEEKKRKVRDKTSDLRELFITVWRERSKTEELCHNKLCACFLLMLHVCRFEPKEAEEHQNAPRRLWVRVSFEISEMFLCTGQYSHLCYNYSYSYSFYNLVRFMSTNTTLPFQHANHSWARMLWML